MDSKQKDPILPEVDEHQPDELHSVRHGFVVANTHFLLPQGVFSEYINHVNTCNIPGTPPWFLGIANHRGETIPIFDLDKVFAPNTEVASFNGVLLLGSHPNTVGIALRKSPVVLVNPEHVEDAMVSPELRTFIIGTYVVKEQTWFDLDHHRLFSDLRARF